MPSLNYNSRCGIERLVKIKKKGRETNSKKKGEIIPNGNGWNILHCDTKSK